jgi:hypothetical protein
MKFPKHIMLDITLNPLTHSSNLVNKASYDSLYKFTKSSNKLTKLSKSTTFRNWLSFQKSQSPNCSTTFDNLLLLCGLATKSTPFVINNHFNSSQKVTASLIRTLDRRFLETENQVEKKLFKTLGLTTEQSTNTLFNLLFLRKEDIYTKLKYSRCPQYDMVSGGLAALFAAFLGFLICEKFGLELLDSGDFYIAFMYGVFATFSLRPLTRCITRGESSYHVLSPKHLFTFLFLLFQLLTSSLKSLLRV